MADYFAQVGDTHELVNVTDGLEVRVYPNIVAEVRFDAFARRWFVSGKDIETQALDCTDVNASDDQIMAAVFELPVVYRVVIHR